MTEISIGEKDKLINKWTDKQHVAVFVTQYNSSLSSFIPNFSILTQEVAEKSLTEKCPCIIIKSKTEKARNIEERR